MKPEIETMSWAREGISLHAYCRRARSFDWNWHYHPEMELTLITRGTGTRLVGDSSARYRKGDLVLLGPGLPHTWFSPSTGRSASSNEAIVIQFRPEAYPDALLALAEFHAIRSLFLKARRGLRFPEHVAMRLEAAFRALPPTSGPRAWIQMTALLQQLAECPSEGLASSAYRNKRVARLESRLEGILDHVERNCGDSLTLEEVASHSGMTPSSFARFFRKMTGRTFVDYRNACRVEKARRLLDETDERIVDIAYASGFQSLPSFNRDFRKRIRQTPREYRKLRTPPALKGG